MRSFDLRLTPATNPRALGRWWWNLFETPAEVRFAGGQLVGGNDFGVFVGAHGYFPTATGIRHQNLTGGEEDERGDVTVSDALIRPRPALRAG
jgi:hypothetical protein